MSCIYVHTDKTNGKQTPCSRPVFGKGNHCVFHATEVGAKATAFSAALAELLTQASSSPEPVDLDFKGFVFPRADFRKYIFRGIADFRAAIFTEDVDFRGAAFHQQADFHTTEFNGDAGFYAVVFASGTRMLGANFRGRAIFNGCKFRGSTAFHGCKFRDFASWQASKFDKPVVFQSNEFVRDADFRHAVFFGGVDFYQTLFRRRGDFEGGTFSWRSSVYRDSHRVLEKAQLSPCKYERGGAPYCANVGERTPELLLVPWRIHVFSELGGQGNHRL